MHKPTTQLEYYSVLLLRNELPIGVTASINLQGDWLSERSQKQKGYIPHNFMYKILWKRQNYKDKNQIGGCQGLVVGGGDWLQRDMRGLWGGA